MNIAIWGLGVSGLSTLKYLTTYTEHHVFAINRGGVSLWPQKKVVFKYIKENKCYCENDVSELEGKLDLIILSPGIAPDIEYLSGFKDVRKVSEIEFTYNLIDIPIVAITGTNGKTTTVTMLAKALTQGGKKVFLGGNIGTPFCEILMSKDEFDIAVLELSSFQLELMDKFHPQVSVILNITENHMERYDSFEDYKKAKLNILNKQNEKDLFISHRSLQTPPIRIPRLDISPLKNFDFSHSKLQGEHSRFNLDVVAKVLSYFKISESAKIIQNLIDTFRGVEFRLEYLGEKRGVEFYNDAKSTNSASVLSAVSSFLNKKVILIMGGQLRGDSQKLKDSFSSFSNIKKIYAFGESKEFIFKELSSSFEVIRKDCLESSLTDVELEGGDVVVFSPGFPSFDQYKNYIERGHHFTKLVGKLP